MRLLLTRASEDAERTKISLEALSHRVVVSPVIEIVGTEANWPTGVVDVLFATSRQAFNSIDETTGPSPEARRLMPAFLVGEKTADAAREKGFMGAFSVSPNVAVLAVAIGKLSVAPRRAIYVAGTHRKPDLETALDVIGIHPEIIETYEARAISEFAPDALDALHKGSLEGVLHFSHRSANLFAQMAKAAEIDIRPLTHFCLSEDTASPLRSAGCELIRVAEQPNESALLRLIDPS